MTELEEEQFNEDEFDQIVVAKSALPLHCPMPDSSLWNSHPRVFLPIEETGKAKCPYCGTEYILVN